MGVLHQEDEKQKRCFRSGLGSRVESQLCDLRQVTSISPSAKEEVRVIRIIAVHRTGFPFGSLILR